MKLKPDKPFRRARGNKECKTIDKVLCLNTNGAEASEKWMVTHFPPGLLVASAVVPLAVTVDREFFF